MNFRLLGLTASIAIGLAACNNSDTNTGSTTDSTTTTTATTTTSTTNYSAMADTIEKNSQAGYYLNPKTGKPLHVKMDRSTGKITDAESSTPVNRYVDKRTWWVYGGDKWDTVGTAKMQGDNIMYEDQSGKWVDYDTRWKDADMNNANPTTNMSDSGMNNSGSSTTTDNTSNGNSKMTGNTKVKVSDHGNKVKIKTKEKE